MGDFCWAVLQEHNEYFDTNYKNIEEFNKGEVYRKITKLTHGGKMHGAGQFAEGGNTSHKYKVYYNSYDSEGDSIDSREIIEVYANSFSEAENIARTTLEEGSRDEEFVILDIKKHVNLGKMAKGGLTNLEGTTTPKAYPMGEPNINVVV